ncbi:MAG TPA: hypothetical protein PL115_00540 [Bacteroidales bacterium]|jgi:hypothetical protein|nr:hypothetical protein [Bacteroidales bacterium]HPY21489.1 hypothetical protein [Bacteroidales bacterium]HQP78331.1 hypothetical protein [Bacteroidales bacterium]
MKKLRTGITLIVLGNVLYVSKDLFANIGPNAFGEFAEGFLLGMGVGLNVIGIILVFIYLARATKKDQQ